MYTNGGTPQVEDLVKELSPTETKFLVTGITATGAVLGSPNYPAGIDPGYLELLLPASIHRCHHHHCNCHHHSSWNVMQLKELESHLSPEELLGYLKAFYISHGDHKHLG